MIIRRFDDGRPLGVTGCLRAGFEIVSRRPWLVLFPVVMDLLLWLGPRLSLHPAQVAEWFSGPLSLATTARGLDPASLQQIEQAAEYLAQVAERLNLFSLVSLAPLLSVPSLTAHRAFYYRIILATPLGERPALLVSGPGAAVAWTAVLLLLGLLIAFVYLVSLAGPVRHLRRSRPGVSVDGSAGAGTDPFSTQDTRARLRGYAGRLGQLLLFAACVLAAVSIALPIVAGSLVAGASVSLGLGIAMSMLGAGLAYYIGLQLAFVVPAIVLGGRRLLPAIRESVTILYVDSGATIWFFLSVFLLYQIAGSLWSLAEPDSWTLAASIVGNGCVGTALTAAAFVFYQERAARLRRLPARVETPSRSSDDAEEGKD